MVKVIILGVAFHVTPYDQYLSENPAESHDCILYNGYPVPQRLEYWLFNRLAKQNRLQAIQHDLYCYWRSST